MNFEERVMCKNKYLSILPVFISPECTIGMVWGLASLKYYGKMAVRQ